MRDRNLPASFKCYHNLHKVGSVSSDDLFYKMVIHVHSDSAFRRYQKELRYLNLHYLFDFRVLDSNKRLGLNCLFLIFIMHVPSIPI